MRKSPQKPAPGMRKGRKSWAAKLRPEMEPEVVEDGRGRGRMLLPTPRLVAEEIAAIPQGGLLTVPQLRQSLARRSGADFTCPLMTGIFFNIIAGASGEAGTAPGNSGRVEDGSAPPAIPLPVPWWRVILEDRSLSPKTPPGPEHQAELLRLEGHTISRSPRGSKLKVEPAAADLSR